LVRFDAVYYGHFKCNTRRLTDYPAIWAYTRDLYQMPGVAGTVSIDEYKAHYYGSHRSLNPTGIVPIGPKLDFTEAHGRAEALLRLDPNNSASVTALHVPEEDSTVEVPAFKQTGSAGE
jgi:putative glutathione S-transferase